MIEVLEKTRSVVINGQEVLLPSNLKTTLVAGDNVLVLLNSDNLSHTTHPHANGNIVCFDRNGNWLWEIEHRTITPEEARQETERLKKLHIYGQVASGAYNPFSRMELCHPQDGSNKPRLIAWNGDHRAQVDLETGKFISYEFTK
jgi:hypothetical protein